MDPKPPACITIILFSTVTDPCKPDPVLPSRDSTTISGSMYSPLTKHGINPSRHMNSQCQTSINHKSCPRYITRARTTQEDHDPCNLIQLRSSTEWAHLCNRACWHWILLTFFLNHRCADPAGTNCINAHSFTCTIKSYPVVNIVL